MTKIEQLLDEYDYDAVPKWAEAAMVTAVFNYIIEFRALARALPEEERERVTKKIAEYNNRMRKKAPTGNT